MSTTEGKGQQEEEGIMEIKKSIVIDASPEVVFKAIIDPDELTNWFPDQAILEPKVGGRMKLVFAKKKIASTDKAAPTKGLLPNLFQIRKFPIRGKIRTRPIF